MARRKHSQLDWNYDSENEGNNSVQETVRIPHTEVNMGDLGLSLLTLLTCPPLLPQPRKKPLPPIPISITMKASSLMKMETPDLMKMIPPISMTVMMTSIQLTHTILWTWTLVGPKPNVNPECVHFY